MLYTALAYGLSSILGLPGVALAFSLAYAVLALLCLVSTREEIRHVDGRRLLRSLLKISAAGAAMYATARFGVFLLGPGSGTPGRAFVLLVAGGSSLAVYLAAASLLGIEELRSVVSSLKRRRFFG